MLTAAHLEKLKADTGVEPWTFEQHEGEAVIIPAGCPHQVSIVASCTLPQCSHCSSCNRTA